MNVWTRHPHWLRYAWPRAETELTLSVKGHNQLYFPRGAHLTLCKLILLVFLFCLFVLFYYLHHYLSGYYAEWNRRWRPGYWTAGEERGVENEKGQGNTQETPKSAEDPGPQSRWQLCFHASRGKTECPQPNGGISLLMQYKFLNYGYVCTESRWHCSK